MAIGLIVISIGSFIAGAACIGIQLEKVKRQRDEALKRVKDLENIKKSMEAQDEKVCRKRKTGERNAP